MSRLNKSEIQEIARELIEEHNEEFEYSTVYEDDRFGEFEDQWREIHDMMYRAKITVSFEEEK